MIAGRPNGGVETAYQVQQEPTSIVARHMLHATMKALQHKRWTNFGEAYVGNHLA
jgi:hypothetical protein